MYCKRKCMNTIYGCFRKRRYPQIFHFDKVFHYKPSILGYPYSIILYYIILYCIILYYIILYISSFSFATTTHSPGETLEGHGHFMGSGWGAKQPVVDSWTGNRGDFLLSNRYIRTYRIHGTDIFYLYLPWKSRKHVRKYTISPGYRSKFMKWFKWFDHPRLRCGPNLWSNDDFH